MSLLQIGITFEAVKWIMTCVESSNFSIFINWDPLEFLKRSRRIFQGFPTITPLVFVKMAWVKILTLLRITHILFVDYIILFERGALEEWGACKLILDHFYVSTGMKVNPDKSICIYWEVEYSMKDQLK